MSGTMDRVGKSRLFLGSAILSALAVLIGTTAVEAGLNHLPSTYGILAEDIGRAGCSASGLPNPAACYHNPAALADIMHTQCAVGYLYARPDFRGGLRNQERGFQTANQVTSLCMALDLGRLFLKDYPLAMGIDMLFDDNFRTMITFRDWRDPRGRFLRYGISRFVLINSLGVRVFEGVNIGAGYILATASSVLIKQNVSISGATSDEQIEQKAKPRPALIIGVQFHRGAFRAGLVFREKMVETIDPSASDTSVILFNDIVFRRYDTYSRFKDAYIPRHLSLGIEFPLTPSVSMGLQADWLNWSQFMDEISSCDDARRDIHLRTKNIVVPRFAAVIKPSEDWEIRAGYAFEPSPFTALGCRDNLVLDNNRHRFTVGAGVTLYPALLSNPITIDAAFLWLHLEERWEETIDGQSLHSEGDLLGLSASITLQF